MILSVAITVGWLTTLVQTEIKFDTHSHDPVRINCNDFCDPFTFHLAPSSGQNLNTPILRFMSQYLQNESHNYILRDILTRKCYTYNHFLLMPEQEAPCKMS